MALWQYALLFVSVLLGGGIALLGDGQRLRSRLPYLLSFSGAFLLGITALELIPEVFTRAEGRPGVWLLGGFLLQLLLESLSQGVEHGHIHTRHNASSTFGLGVLLGLCMHAFIEGLPLSGLEDSGFHAEHDHRHNHLGQHLLFGIVLHKIPAAFALGLLLRFSGYRKRFIYLALLLFALMGPLGAWVGERWVSDQLWVESALALVIGSLLHISTTILFEADSQRQHAISWRKLMVIGLGLGLAGLAVV
ncbi:MAG: ZIP family metal transporter [Bacteroidota bacterium]